MNTAATHAQRIDIWRTRRKDIIAFANTARIDKVNFNAEGFGCFCDVAEQLFLRGIARLWRAVKSAMRMGRNPVAF